MSSKIERDIARQGETGNAAAYANITTNTTTALVTGVAGQKTRVSGLVIAFSATTGGTVAIQDGGTTKFLVRVANGTTGTYTIPLGKAWELAAAATLNIVTTGLASFNIDASAVYTQGL